MKKLVLAAALAGAAVVSQATNYYWSGLGGDNDWSTVENWAKDQDLTKPASAAPGSGDYVYFCVSRYTDHQTTVTVSSSVTCGNIYLRDEISPGTVTIRGVGEGRIAFTPAVFSWKTAGNPGCGVVLHLENLEMVKNANIFAYTTSDGNGIVFDNCKLDISTQTLTPPYGEGSLYVVRDSEFTYGQINRANTGSLIFAVTNSTMNGGSSINLRAGNGDYSIYGSTLRLAGDVSFAGNNSGEGQTYPNERIRFANSTLDLGNAARNFKCFSQGGRLEFDNVTVLGSFGSIEQADDGSIVVKDTVMRFNRGSSSKATNDRGLIELDNAEWVVTNGYTLTPSVGVKYVIRGKATRLMPGLRWQGGKAVFDFIVPVGGYDRPPVGVDGVLTTYNNVLFNAVNGGAINVLPESPAARVDATKIYPLIYVYTGANGNQVNLKACPPTGLPTAESGYCVSQGDSSVAFDEVNAQPESWWTPVDAGYNASVAALAVKIVGHDSRIPQLGGFELTGLGSEGATFALTVDNIGELPEGEKAASATPTLLIRLKGTQAWTELPQTTLTAEGVAVLTAAKDKFPEAGLYECGARLVNSFGLSSEFILPEPIEVNFTKPVLSALSFDGEGVETTVFGELRGTGASATAALTLEVSEVEDFSSGVTAYDIGTFSAGESYEKTVPVNPGVLTYFRVTATAGEASASVSGSDVSRTVATIGEITAVNTNGLCRVAVDGSVVARGAGVSTVKLRYSMDGISWKTNVIGTVSEDESAFTGDCAFPMVSGTAHYEILVENSSGDHTWVAASGVETLPVKDYSTYYWRAVENEWDGDWNDGRHWLKPDLPDDVTLYPQVDTATASFRDCPDDGSEVVVTLPANVTVKQVESATAGQRLTFTGESGTTMTATMAINQQSSATTFDKITWDSSKTDLEAKEKLAYFLVNGAQLKLYRFYSRTQGVILYIGEDCTATLEREGQEGGGKEFIVDNGHLVHAGFVGQNSGSGVVSYVLRGKKAKVDFSNAYSYLNLTWKNVRFVFEIPEGGYNDVPVQLMSGSNSFLWLSGNPSPFCQPGDDNGLIYAIADNSPALLTAQGKTIEQDLFVWNKTGFAKGDDGKGNKYDLIDYTQLQVPTTTSTGRKVKGLTMSIRGIDEIDYDSPAALKAAGTTAYAVSCRIERSPGLLLILK